MLWWCRSSRVLSTFAEQSNSALNKNEGGSFPLCKKCTLVVANKTILLHGKDNTFRSGHSEVAERFDQVLVFSSEVQEKVYRQIDEESPLNT